MFQIWPQLLHLAGGTTFIEEAQARFQGVQTILYQPGFQLGYLVRGPAAEINGGDVRRFFLGRIVFGQRREFAMPEILDTAEIY